MYSPYNIYNITILGQKSFSQIISLGPTWMDVNRLKTIHFSLSLLLDTANDYQQRNAQISFEVSE